jgi:hypothetical protein
MLARADEWDFEREALARTVCDAVIWKSSAPH